MEVSLWMGYFVALSNQKGKDLAAAGMDQPHFPYLERKRHAFHEPLKTPIS